jgi:hypothetical protein
VMLQLICWIEKTQAYGNNNTCHRTLVQSSAIVARQRNIYFEGLQNVWILSTTRSSSLTNKSFGNNMQNCNYPIY